MPQITVISLGWGVQSFGLVAMSVLGILPKVDYAIHADTGWERAETYAFAQAWTPWLEARGIPVITVQAPAQVRSIEVGVTPPFYTRGPKGAGHLDRTCTERWKIRPIHKWLRSEMKRRGLKLLPNTVEQWIGFTTDEASRAQLSLVQYIALRYPYLEPNFLHNRSNVIHFLKQHNLDVPPKSACIICPFQRAHRWRQMKTNTPNDWQRAIRADRVIRHKRPSHLCYLSDQRKPLIDHDFTSQMDLPQFAEQQS